MLGGQLLALVVALTTMVTARPVDRSSSSLALLHNNQNARLDDATPQAQVMAAAAHPVSTRDEASGANGAKPIDTPPALTLVGIAAIVLVLVIVLAQVCERAHIDQTVPANSQEPTASLCKRLRALEYSMVALSMCLATVIIPEAYDLMRQLGFDSAAGSTMSGLLIGLGFVLSGVVSLGVTRQLIQPPWRQSRNRMILISVQLSTAVLAITYALGANPPWNASNTSRLALLVLGRVGIGCFGPIRSLMRMMTLLILPESQLVAHNVYRMLAMSFGIGLGPLLASVVNHVAMAILSDAVLDVSVRAAAPCFVVAALLFGWSIVFYLVVPAEGLGSPQDELALPPARAQAQLQSQKPTGPSERAPASERATGAAKALAQSEVSMLWVFALLVGIERAFLVAALESATAAILELEFGIPSIDTGVLVGVTFTYGMPLTLGVLACRRRAWLSDTTLALGLPVASVPLTLPLFRELWLPLAPTARMWLVLISDIFVFPIAYVSQGIVDGIALRHGMQAHPSWFSRENFLVCSVLCTDTLGRSTAPLVSRAILASGGRSAYAAVQLVGVLLSAVTINKVVRLGGSLEEKSKARESE